MHHLKLRGCRFWETITYIFTACGYPAVIKARDMGECSWNIAFRMPGRGEIDGQELTVYYDFQCPYICQSVELVRQYCGERQIPVSLRLVDTQQKAKELPCVFNNWAVFYQGKLQTVNLLDAAALKRMFQREEGRPV